jgi:DNA ligase 1
MESVAPNLSASAFSHFAAACDAAHDTPSKIQKTAALATYLRSLGKSDVGIAARFLAAQPFAPSTGKSLVMGGALVIDTIRAAAGIPDTALSQAFRAHGEIGEAIRSHWPLPTPEAVPLTLCEIQTAFSNIAATGSQDSKRRLLADLLRRCAPADAVYLLKIILGDMRIGVSAGVIESALAQAFNFKLADLRAARQLVGDLDAVAELAFDGDLARAAFRPFVPLGAMLAQPVMTSQEIIDTLAGRPAIAEDKYDGIRAQLHASCAMLSGASESSLRASEPEIPLSMPADAPKLPPRAELFSRGSGTVSHSFPDIIHPVERFISATGHTFVLDGEIVPMRISPIGEVSTLPFSSLQRRLGRKNLTPRLLRESPCAFIAFDLLYLDGQLLLSEPLSTRRQKLQSLFDQAKSFITEAPLQTKNSERTTNNYPFVLGPAQPVTDAPALDALFSAARARRNEGLVIKRLDSFYTPGRRGDAWLKLKSHLPTLDVVVVAAELGHGKRKNVLSDLTFAVRNPHDDGAPDELAVIGKAYTGLTDTEIAQLTEHFISETLEHQGRLRLVRPTVVLEVAFDQITRSDRHNSGFALRFPRIVRLRPDKSLSDIDTLENVRAIYNSPDNLAVKPEDEKHPHSPPTSDQLSLF